MSYQVADKIDVVNKILKLKCLSVTLMSSIDNFSIGNICLNRINIHLNAGKGTALLTDKVSSVRAITTAIVRATLF